MRPVVLTSMVVLFAACGAPDIEDSLATDDIPMPERAPPRPDAGAPEGGGPALQPETVTLTVTLSGPGSIASMPGGVTCAGTTCSGTFERGTAVTLSAASEPGSVFAGWSGACSGTAACATSMDGDVAIGAAFQSLDGPWSGTYTNTRVASGCTFNNAGNLSITFSAAGATLTSAGNVTGLQLRSIPSCALVGTTTGAAPSAAVTLAGDTLTGTWTFAVQGAAGTLAFPFTAKVTDKTITGTWTCPTCAGSFTLTKP
ncbi:MAG: hypothetical protein KF819_04990 [Labilithrix sp.]|nr:hypothetical protein [Labilithrix sp.]